MKKRPMRMVLEELVSMSQQPMDEELRRLADPQMTSAQTAQPVADDVGEPTDEEMLAAAEDDDELSTPDDPVPVLEKLKKQRG